MKKISISLVLTAWLVTPVCEAEQHEKSAVFTSSSDVNLIKPNKTQTSDHFDGAKILVFGDFGTGKENQVIVANSMIDYCQQKTCDFGVTVGDNIYPEGVQNQRNGEVDYDYGMPNYDIITEIFVKKYRNLNIPIYMSYGNHDVGDMGWIKNLFKDWFKGSDFLNKRKAALMNNQVVFTNSPDNPALKYPLSPKKKLWNFPSQFYEIQEQASVHLWSIDTNSYPHQALDEKNEIDKNRQNFKQKKWLESHLRQSQSVWKIVFGHVPLFSHGIHGWLDSRAINRFKRSIIDTLCENKVDFYLSGHEHLLEIDQYRCPNGHLLVAIISGVAAKDNGVHRLSFPLFSPDTNLLWANGQHFNGDSSMYRKNKPVLGFTYIDLKARGQAELIMKLSKGRNKNQADGSFKIIKGRSIKPYRKVTRVISQPCKYKI